MGFYDFGFWDQALQDLAMKPFCYSPPTELKMSFVGKGCIRTNSSNQVVFMDSFCNPNLSGEDSDHLDRSMRLECVQIIRSMIQKVSMRMLSINIENSLSFLPRDDNFIIRNKSWIRFFMKSEEVVCRTSCIQVNAT
ncbi:hypothetical protein KC19_10G132300 [Ceratodon purpureus]|uniref:Uncharacterized protein n=1 Tax=Ceratodon purpureus TaxID=3225 RepID=A0A8T0GMT4_CERPU|nr:hypothetical protein KC19_10G132300 [Ceratodon purpureus]